MNSPLATDVAFFVEHGITAVISLCETTIDSELFVQNKIVHKQLCLPDYRPMAADKYDEFIDFVNLLKLHEGSNRLCVHCNAGMGRTGTVLAMLLVMLHKMSAADAIRCVRSQRRGSVQTFKQEDGVEQFAKYLEARRQAEEVQRQVEQVQQTQQPAQQPPP